MKHIVRALAVLAFAVSTVLAAPAAHAVNQGSEGCTPGYWKTHPDSWTWGEGDSEWVTTDTPFSFVYTGATGTSVAGVSMLDALSLNGGSGVEGAERILARAAVAAWANAAHEGLGYPLRRQGDDGLLAMVNAAFESGDREQMLDLAAQLDQYNNLGCPLS